MYPRSLLTLVSLFLFTITQAQSLKITGKVVNEKNEPVQGVSIQVTGGNGTSSASDGSFQLNLNSGAKYELSFSAVGYETKIISEVELLPGQLNELNVTLKVAAKQETGVVITTRTTQRKESVNSLIQFQKNTNTVASVISAESIRRSPDRNTGDVLKRTPGASVQDGKFLVIRGLADRYNQAMLDGILLTSTEPDRKTFSFDLIPAFMVDNIVINKAFVPEYPGEWAGGLIQVNTKDIPVKNFFNIEVGIGANSQTTGKAFYKDPAKGNFDWLGVDDGTRGLPAPYTTKSSFDTASRAGKIQVGKNLRNAWVPEQTTAPLNFALQANGGFTKTMRGKKLGGIFGLIYSNSYRYQDALNRRNVLDDVNHTFTIENSFNDERYLNDISAGAIGSLSLQLNSMNKITLKGLINVNTTNAAIRRTGVDRSRPDSMIMGTDMTFRENIFFTSQIIGEHTLATPLKLKWYGSFNILNGYDPDQRRLMYSKADPAAPYTAVIANSLSQQSGSRIYQSLSDYIYTAGGDLTYSFNGFGEQKQALKGGYLFQVKDRLYDAQLFANYLPLDNPELRKLPADQIFAEENFGDGTENKFAFDAIKNKNFRYLANTILNAGYLQLDNQFSDAFRVVWGVRFEHYDQLIGSVKQWDPRHTHSVISDFLPGLNATLKLNAKTNLRVSGSQTVIRPELRELSSLNLYDFELNASVQGKPDLRRTKVSNLDLRYEYYSRAGEVVTAGVFYKNFKDPIEQIYTEGSGGASTFTFQNPEKANSYGAEFELRKKLDFVGVLKNFTFQTNVAYIRSRIQDSLFKIDRPLQGQSPYVVNVGLLYDLPKYGLNSTLLFNQVGERIYLVGDKSAGAGSPDIYEAPRPVLDFQITKSIIKNKGQIKLNVSDIFNKTQYFYQNPDPNENLDFQKNADAYRFTRKFGTRYGLTFSYSL
jgi:TonB-dependent receptor